MTEKERAAFEAARHELVTLHGLVVADGASPKETWALDTSKAVALIDEVVNAAVTVPTDGQSPADVNLEFCVVPASDIEDCEQAVHELLAEIGIGPNDPMTDKARYLLIRITHLGKWDVEMNRVRSE